MIVVSSNISCRGLVKAEFFFKGARGWTERVTPIMYLMLSWQNDIEAPLYSGYFLCSWNINKEKRATYKKGSFLNTHSIPTSISSFFLNEDIEFRRNK